MCELLGVLVRRSIMGIAMDDAHFSFFVGSARYIASHPLLVRHPLFFHSPKKNIGENIHTRTKLLNKER